MYCLIKKIKYHKNGTIINQTKVIVISSNFMKMREVMAEEFKKCKRYFGRLAKQSQTVINKLTFEDKNSCYIWEDKNWDNFHISLKIHKCNNILE